jgi:hypothetical protein
MARPADGWVGHWHQVALWLAGLKPFGQKQVFAV